MITQSMTATEFWQVNFSILTTLQYAPSVWDLNSLKKEVFIPVKMFLQLSNLELNTWRQFFLKVWQIQSLNTENSSENLHYF